MGRRSRGDFKFQFTPPREGRLIDIDTYFCLYIFQFTPPREGRRNEGVFPGVPDDFNSRPRVRGDLVEKVLLPKDQRFQFTPPREGRQFQGNNWDVLFIISIHAPA